MPYTELSIEERVAIQMGRHQALSQREIACLLRRSPSAISRELRRNTDSAGDSMACGAQTITRERRKVCCPLKS